MDETRTLDAGTTRPALHGETETRKALEAAREALANCYDVQNHPADGNTEQDKAITAIDAALASEDVQGWRTMGSAPKDGTCIDLWRDGERIIDAYWRDNGIAGWCFDNSYQMVTTVLLDPPQFWRAAPPAPEPRT